jgi:uncharacterized protein (DUF2345 family)
VQDCVVIGTPSNRAFVIKLSAAGQNTSLIAGRVEHVSSGQSARFEVLDELGTFLARILAQEQAEADSQPEALD